MRVAHRAKRAARSALREACGQTPEEQGHRESGLGCKWCYKIRSSTSRNPKNFLKGASRRRFALVLRTSAIQPGCQLLQAGSRRGDMLYVRRRFQHANVKNLDSSTRAWVKIDPFEFFGPPWSHLCPTKNQCVHPCTSENSDQIPFEDFEH